MVNKEHTAQGEKDSAPPQQQKTPTSTEKRSKTVEDHLKEREKISNKIAKKR